MRAVLREIVGSKARRSVMVGRGGITDLPDPVALRLVPDGAGFALIRVDTSGVSVSHTWHPSLEDAKARAARDYGVADGEWVDEGAPSN
jgi:hypothetical protein